MADKLQMTFTGGELSPQAYGRVDLAKYQSGLKTLRNFYVHPLGGVVNRAGTEFIGYTKNQHAPVREIPFEYNADQQYVFEFGHLYLRIKVNGGYVLEPSFTILDITGGGGDPQNPTIPAVVTTPGGTISTVSNELPAVVTMPTTPDVIDGEWIRINDVDGMPDVNDKTYRISNLDVGAKTFELLDELGNEVDMSYYAAAGTGGTAGHGYSDEDWICIQAPDSMKEVHNRTFIVRNSTATAFELFDVRTINVASVSNVSQVTQADPAQVTTAEPHGLRAGDIVQFSAVVGMTELNDQYYVVQHDPLVDGEDTFTLKDFAGVDIDSTLYNAYVSDGQAERTFPVESTMYAPFDTLGAGGAAARIKTVATPYTDDDLQNITYDQSADVMTVCVGGRWWPREITRGSAGHHDFNISCVGFRPQIAAPTITEVNQAYSWSIEKMEKQAVGLKLNWDIGDDNDSVAPFDNLFIGSKIIIDEVNSTGSNEFADALNGNSFIITSKDNGNKFIRLANVDGIAIDPTLAGWDGDYDASDPGKIFQNSPLRFRVTAVSKDGEESLSSAYGEKTFFINNVPDSNYFADVKITHPNEEDVDHYNFYRMQRGIYGFVGTWEDKHFFAQNIEPDLIDVAPPDDPANPFAEFEDAVVIESITLESPGVLTTKSAHFCEDDDVLKINKKGYMTDVNGTFFVVKKIDDTTLELHDFSGIDVDTSTYTPYQLSEITGFTNATTAVVTSVAHGLEEGDSVYISHVNEDHMPEPNGKTYVVGPSPGANSFDLHHKNGTAINSTNWGVWNNSGGYINAGTMERCNPAHFPGVISFHEQRRMFGRSDAYRQRVWGTQIGNLYNMNETHPPKADDAISFDLIATHANEIRHLISMQKLFIFTSGGEWVSDSGDNGYTATNIRNRPHSTNGVAKNPRPLQIGSTILYVQEMGNSIWDLRYSFEADSYGGGDRSLLSEHLFEGKQIVDWAYQRVPSRIVWVVFDDGTMASMTYLPEHEIWGWGRHDTDGKYESVTAINEGEETVVYVTVKRTIDGFTRRFSERMHTRNFTDVRDCHFVDSGLKHDNPLPITNIENSGVENTVSCVVTSPKHGLSEGELVDFSDIVGMTELNGDHYAVANKKTNTFEIMNMHTGNHHTIIGIQSGGGGALVSFGQLETAASIEHIDIPTDVITVTAHGYSNDDVIFIEGTQGTLDMNDTLFVVTSVTPNTFKLLNMDQSAVNILIWTSGGTVTRCNAVHALTDGGYVKIVDVVGLEGGGESQVNDRYFKVTNVTSHTANLTTLDNDLIVLDGLTPYDSEGRMEDVSTIDCRGFTPYEKGGFIRRAISELRGLDHLEGKMVSILADGNVEAPQTVVNGSITLPSGPAGRIHVGLPYVSQLESLDVTDVQGQLAGRLKSVSKAIFRLNRTRSLHAGPNLESLTLLKEREFEDYDEPTSFLSGEYFLTVTPEWNTSGGMAVQQSDPLPVTIQSIGFDLDVSNI
jgi:hypothetical protein